MGKGTIVEAIGNGQYSIELDLEASRVAASITRLTARVAELSGLVDTAELELSTASAAYAENPGRETLADYLSAKNKVAKLSIEKISAEKQLSLLQSVPQTITLSAWCADATEDLSGVVGTIEVPGERGMVQIQPGYGGNASYNPARDGQLQPAIAGTPANVYRNWALLPGWQKWKPTYRYGTITAIDDEADECDVTLFDIKSSQQGLSINQTPTLLGVPIVYMECNAAAFEVGDSVLVEFLGQDWGFPRVIGFYSDPRPCSTKVQIRINGNACQYAKKIRLYHPEYGYTDKDIYSDGIGYTDNAGEFDLADYVGETPGGQPAEDCYIEVWFENYVATDDDGIISEGGVWLNYNWECLGDIYMPDAGNDAECADATQLRQYDIFLIGSVTDLDITLDPLGPDERKTVVFVNNEYATYSWINGVQVGNPSPYATHAIEFFWNGVEWTHTWGPFDYEISLRQLRHWSGQATPYSPVWPYAAIYKERYGHSNPGDPDDGPYKITAPCVWYRSEVPVRDMGVTDGVRTLSISNVKTLILERYAPEFSVDAVCGCEPIVYPDPVVNDHYIIGTVGLPFPTGSQGGNIICPGGVYTAMISQAYIYAGDDDATDESLCILSDRYAQASASYGDFIATTNYYCMTWELVDEEHDEHPCYGSNIYLSDLGYVSIEISNLADGYY